jgi:hypothetical protein
MKIFDLEDDSGIRVAFEVSNWMLGRKAACRIAESIPGTKILERPSLFRSKEEFCKFELGARCFVIAEPYNDNSRYWIGPVPTEPCLETDTVREAFSAYSPV